MRPFLTHKRRKDRRDKVAAQMMLQAYLDAGCIAVNLGPSLAVPDLVRSKQWDEIGRRVLLATSIVQSRRSTVARDSTYVH